MQKRRKLLIKKIRDQSGCFKKIIKVEIPTLFFFDEEGEFEAMEITRDVDGSLNYLKPYSRQLAREVLRAVNGEEYMPKRTAKGRTPIPRPFRDALENGETKS